MRLSEHQVWNHVVNIYVYYVVLALVLICCWRNFIAAPVETGAGKRYVISFLICAVGPCDVGMAINQNILVHAAGVAYSTIVRLLLRFYDVDSGSILIDGENVKSFTQRSLRKTVGVVAQDTVRVLDGCACVLLQLKRLTAISTAPSLSHNGLLN